VVPWLGNGRSGRSSLAVQELTGPELEHGLARLSLILRWP
jgi:hypothetical protein